MTKPACETCKGEGEIVENQGFMRIRKPCPDCHVPPPPPMSDEWWPKLKAGADAVRATMWEPLQIVSAEHYQGKGEPQTYAVIGPVRDMLGESRYWAAPAGNQLTKDQVIESGIKAVASPAFIIGNMEQGLEVEKFNTLCEEAGDAFKAGGDAGWDSLASKTREYLKTGIEDPFADLFEKLFEGKVKG